MKQVIFLFVTPALSGDEKKYKLPYLMNLGYKIEIGDLTPVLEPETDKAISHDRLNYDGIKYMRFNNKAEIEEYLTHHKKDFFLPMFNDYFDVRFIYQLFTKYKIQYGYVNNLEADFDSSILTAAYIAPSKRMDLHHLTEAFYNRVIRKIPVRKNADFCAIGTQYSLERLPKICDCDDQTKLLMVHTFDYERFCDVEPYNHDKKDYAVFIDQYLPYHPDSTVDADIHINPEIYYKEVGDILNAIEKKTGIEIIIAAHPRSDYRNKPQCFSGYLVKYGKTSELIKGSCFVIGHFSTAIGMAVLGNKPVIIVDNKAVSSIKSFDNICRGYAEQLNGSLLRTAGDVDELSFFVDRSKYDAYEKRFMTTGENNNKSIWDVVDDFLQKNSG